MSQAVDIYRSDEIPEFAALAGSRALREDDADSLQGNSREAQCGPRELDIAVLRATQRLRQRGVYPVESGRSIAFDDRLFVAAPGLTQASGDRRAQYLCE
ncbi:hypothetical protein [Paraburkholderia aspalathi]|uniref:hypothetical protein n=1 Tax=Paraburkholderia aspalathi TaxID=1324617 RepID=UPI002AE6A9CA|nr:hypothetical protein [Paraburkholderia sediminicola]